MNFSDTSIEAVELERNWLGKIQPVAVSRITLPVGCITNGIILQPEALADAVEQLWQQAKPQALTSRAVAISIPESQVFSRVLRFPGAITTPQISETIQAQLSHYLPFSNAEVAYDFVTLSRKTDQVDVLLIAVAKTTLQGYRTLAAAAQWKLQTIELESISTARAVIAPQTPGAVVGIIDLGARTTIVSLFDSAGLRFTFNIPLAGNHLTEYVAKQLKLELVEAEQLKCELGLTGKTAKPLQTCLEPLVQKLTEAITYFNDTNHEAVQQFYLVGGTAQLPSMDTWLQDKLGVPCSRAKLLPAWAKNSIVDMMHCNALGLALGALPNYSGQMINFIK